jgi:hypothetical protein
MIRPLTLVSTVTATLVLSSAAACARLHAGSPPERATADTIAVSGSGVDLLSTALVHSKDSTNARMVQKSTEIVELRGDLVGRVLYHVTSVFDFARGTLVNKGDQVYSGTVAGSAPVMLHDDNFQFDVNLRTGEEHGRVYLVHHIAGPTIRCTLDVVGTGMNAQGNPTFTYHGQCTTPRQ